METNIEEIWRDIPGSDGYYQISSHGRILNTQTKLIRRSSIDIHGYCKVYIRLYGLMVNKTVHRFVAIAFIPNPENKPMVNHKNGIKTDNRVENLEWCTARENHQHALKNGLGQSSTMYHGSNNRSAKLTDKQVLEIRSIKASTKITNVKLGHMFNVTPSLIRGIIKRKYWIHI